jgi:imidazole glycerol-phosphate synthase subunit HisF
MLTKRVIACLDCHNGRVVKGVQFLELRDAGDPAELATTHAAAGADEIILLDITATHEARKTLLDTVSRTSQHLFIPLTVGGGIQTLQDAERVFDCGADKVSINSAAVARPELITQIGNRFGAQAVVVAIDAKRNNDKGIDEVVTDGGRNLTGKSVLVWAREAESRGAGEILLTSMRKDGTQSGFDCELTRAVAESVQIPVIASGGAGNEKHFVDVLQKGCADAALAASILHFGTHTLANIKLVLHHAGIAVRLQC